MRYLIIFLLLTGCLFASDEMNSYLVDSGLFPQKQFIDSKHLKAELIIDGPTNHLKAKANLEFVIFEDNLKSVEFYTQHLNISKILLNSKEVKYIQDGNTTKIYFPDNLKKFDNSGQEINYSLQFEYSANPPEGLYFVGWDDKTGRKKKQIWAHSPQGWLPFYNIKRDILTTEMIVTYDKNYKVLSNGKRLSVTENSDGTNTWHYKISHPHVVYLINLVIGDYKWKEFNTERGLPLEYWYYPDREYAFDEAYKFSTEMFDFFEMETGHNYPWSIYRQAPVIDYMYGGMETTTGTIFGDYMFIDNRGWWERPYVNVNAHELSHQWFGNYVSHLNNTHVWITESFATYYAKIFERSIYGEEFYQWEKKKELDRTLEAAKKDDIPVMHSRGGVNRWYPKGSLVLGMLRYVLGDENYKLSIKNYLEEHKYSVTWTPDLIKSIRNTTGESPEWFFDQWIWRGGEPYYEVSYTKTMKDNSSYLLIDVKQIHKTDNLVKYFKMPIVFDAYLTDGTKVSTKEWIDGAYSQVWLKIPDGKELDFLIFDPGREILKQVNFKRSNDELFAQAEKAENMIDRFDALEALQNVQISDKIRQYEKLYPKLNYHLTKSEIIRQISLQDKNLANEISRKIIVSAINDNDAWVRRAAIENFEIIPKIAKNEFEKLLKDSSYTTIMLALDKLSKSFPEHTAKYLDATKNEIGWRGNNIRIKWLEIAINSGKTKHIKELIDYSSMSFEFETNINAFEAMVRLNLFDEAILENLMRGLFHWNFKLKNAASDALKYYYKQNKFKELIDKYINQNEFPASKQNLIKQITN